MKIEDILKLINESESIEKFAEDNLLKLTVSKTDNRYILNYSEQILNTPKNWISHYCRGLVLEGSPHNYQVIARAFERFYHEDEKPPYLEGKMEIDYKRPFTVEFKADGSLILLYFWNGEWRVNTRGSFGHGIVSEVYGKSWAELFVEAFGKSTGTQLKDATKQLDQKYTYIFELCTPYNQVVEYYPSPIVYLLGIRETKTGVWLSLPHMMYPFFKEVGLPTYHAESFEDVLENLKVLGPTQEGFVISQREIGSEEIIRKKIKTETWMKLSHFNNGGAVSTVKLWEVVFKGETGEVAAVFPHLKEPLKDMEIQYELLLRTATDYFEQYNKIADQKEFALAIAACPYKGALFAARSKKATLIEGIQNYLLKQTNGTTETAKSDID